MSNEAAREIISTAAELLEKASAMIDNDNKTFIFHYPLEKCPDGTLKKWLDDNKDRIEFLIASVEVEKELKERQRCGIKIVEVK